MKRFIHNYSLSLVLAALFLSTFLLQTVMGWYDFKAEQQALGESAHILGASGYIWHWGEATFENWQSEFLQLLSFVVLTSFLIHKGSHESKDSDEELRAAITRVERRLESLRPNSAPDTSTQPVAMTATSPGIGNDRRPAA